VSHRTSENILAIQIECYFHPIQSQRTVSIIGPFYFRSRPINKWRISRAGWFRSLNMEQGEISIPTQSSNGLGKIFPVPISVIPYIRYIVNSVAGPTRHIRPIPYCLQAPSLAFIEAGSTKSERNRSLLLLSIRDISNCLHVYADTIYASWPISTFLSRGPPHELGRTIAVPLEDRDTKDLITTSGIESREPIPTQSKGHLVRESLNRGKMSWMLFCATQIWRLDGIPKGRGNS
jgi:hypothetical protein